MANLTQLTTDVNQLQTDVANLSTLVTGTVIPDITKAISLIQSGDSQAAIDALDAIVKQADSTVTSMQSATQQADTQLEGAENQPASPSKPAGS